MDKVEGVDYVVCPVCGKHYKKITGGHMMTHGLDISSFREKFGDIPTECENHIKLKSINEKKVMSDESFRKHRSESSKMQWKDSKIREKRVNAIRKHHSDETFREQCREHSKKVWMDDAYKKEKVSRMLESNKRPDVKAKRSKNMLRLWQDPEFVRKAFDSQSRWVDYIDCYGNTIKLKSSYEVSICSLLSELGINYEYEFKRFGYYFNGSYHSYYPDIYLKDYDLYLEIKPDKLQGTAVNKAKFQSVLDSGCNIVYVGEDYLDNKDKLLDLITTSTTIRK